MKVRINMIDYQRNIAESGLTIYEIIDPNNETLYIPTEHLQAIIKTAMVGLSLQGLPLRTRSKIVKQKICECLGYPIPKSFKKTQPRFYGQNFDVYTQKSLNVQIWNEEITPDRRYVFLEVNEDDIVTNVRVITGDELAFYDNTGKLTTKYQATMHHFEQSHLFATADTDNLMDVICKFNPDLRQFNPNDFPNPDSLLPISELFRRLITLEGREFSYISATQERNRGAVIHGAVCEALGYSIYEDDGKYPDLRNQLLEIKLQTSPTIDLGLHSPEDGCCIFSCYGKPFFSEDVRYAIFDGIVDTARGTVIIDKVYITNGLHFTKDFPLFQGKKQNAKIQLPLPSDFFKK